MGWGGREKEREGRQMKRGRDRETHTEKASPEMYAIKLLVCSF